MKSKSHTTQEELEIRKFWIDSKSPLTFEEFKLNILIAKKDDVIKSDTERQKKKIR